MDFPKNFISATHEACSYDHYVPAPYLRKSFIIDSMPKKAEMLITGLGFYSLHINGRDITKGPCAPYISNPDHYIYYDSYDVLQWLRPGENVIGITLGNGMQNAFDFSICWFDVAPWVGAPMTALRLELTDDNDEITGIDSGEDFKCAPSPIFFDCMRTGEFYDARNEKPGWNDAGFDDSDWSSAIRVKAPRGEAVLCELPPIVVVKEIKPVAIHPSDDGYVYDFGEDWAGLCRLDIDGEAGQEIVMLHGEMFENGQMNQFNLSFQPEDYRQKNIYICKGGHETHVPQFTYHGFQYVLVKGITEKQATPELLTYLVMNSKLEEVGDFSCSDPTLNALQIMTRRSTMANFYYFPTDCPQREKNGWTGDAAVSVEHMLINVTPEPYYHEWLRNIRKAMSEKGALPGIIPNDKWGYYWANGPAWDCALTYLPYFTYVYRGDRAILEENATAIFRYLNYISTVLNPEGLIRIGLGDWCQPNRGGGDYTTPLEFTDTVIGMDICKKAAFIFDVLGLPLQKEFAESLYAKLRLAVRERLIDLNTMTAINNCQTAQAMAIFYDVFEPGEKPAAFGVLVRLIESASRHMDTGILGGRVIFHVLAMFGRADLAFEMITTPTFPSYGYWIACGATSLWEEFQPVHCTSRNHHFWGDISNWFIKWLAGIQFNPFGNNLNEVNITPKFIAALDHASGHHVAPSGKIQVDWKRDGDSIDLTLEVPDGMTGRIILEEGLAFEDGSGVKSVSGGVFKVVKNAPFKKIG